MRKLNDINEFIELQVEYYETNQDYAENLLDCLGDRLQYEGRYSEDEIEDILHNSNLVTSTDYSYIDDDAVTVFSVGEIEIDINTNLTQKEFNAIEDGIDAPCKFNAVDGVITAYICAGMNVRVYSDYEGVKND